MSKLQTHSPISVFCKSVPWAIFIFCSTQTGSGWLRRATFTQRFGFDMLGV